jgi:hypothetical protein
MTQPDLFTVPPLRSAQATLGLSIFGRLGSTAAMQAKESQWYDYHASIEKRRYLVRSRIKLDGEGVSLAMMQHFVHHNVRKKPVMVGDEELIYYYGPTGPGPDWPKGDLG